MINKEISVIVPVFNSGKWIERLIESVLAQNIGQETFEFILVNDKSTDNSIDILNSYQSKFPEIIKVIDKEINEGVAASRDDGLNLSEGKYIVFLDNDDYIDEDYLSTLYNTIENECLDLVISGYKLVDEQGKVVKVNQYHNTYGADYKNPCIWGSIHRSELIKRHNIHYRGRSGDDNAFVYQEFLYTDKIKYIDYIGYNWFENFTSLSRDGRPSIEKNIHDILYLLREGLKNNKTKNLRYDYFMIYSTLYYYHLLSRKATANDFRKFLKVVLLELDKLYPKWRKIPVPQDANLKIKLFMSSYKFVSRTQTYGIFSKLVCK